MKQFKRAAVCDIKLDWFILVSKGFMAKQPNENKDTPNVNLLKIQQELEEFAKEVLAMEGKGFFAKLGLGKKTREDNAIKIHGHGLNA